MEQPPPPRVAATRRWRARERDGKILLRLEVDETNLIIALCDAGFLAINQADDRKAIAVAAKTAFESFIAGDISRHAEGDQVMIRLLLAVLRKKTHSRSRKLHGRPKR